METGNGKMFPSGNARVILMIISPVTREKNC